MVQRHIALADVHSPWNILFKSLLAYIKKYQPTHFIILGDFLNLEFASHWNERLFKHIGLISLKENLKKEIDAGRKLLGQITEALPKDCKKYYVPGNHEAWLFYICLYYNVINFPLKVSAINYKSDLGKIMNKKLAEILRDQLKTEELGFEVLPYNQELKIGKISYFHGHQFRNLNALKRSHPGKNCVMGHHHTHQVDTVHGGKSGRAFQYVAIPCLCKLSPGYLKDGSTRWLNGFWQADVASNGLFDGKVVKILNGEIPSQQER